MIEAVVAASDHRKAAEASEAPLWVQLPGGARLEVGDARQAVLAAELLRALAQRPC